MLSDNTRSFSGNKFLYFGKFDNFAYLQAGWKRHTCPHQISVFICGLSSESIRAAPRGVSADWRREGNRHTLSLGEIWHLTFLAGVLLWMSVTKFQNSSPENVAVRTPEHQVETVIEAAALPQEFVPKQKCELYSGGEDAWADRRWRMISGQHFHLNNTTDRPYLHVCCRHICTWIWPIVPPSTAVCCHDVGIQFHWFLF